MNTYKVQLFLLFWCIILQPTYSQFNQIDLNCTILSKKDSTPIGFVHVLNISSRHGVISENNGTFNFRIGVTDTLIFSVVGFESLKYSASEIPSQIFMEPRSYTLETVTIFPYKSYEDFKKAIIDFSLIDSTQTIENSMFILKNSLFLYSKMNQGAGVTIDGPITALYNLFSKQAKSYKRYEELLAQDRYNSFLATKYNNILVQNATQISIPEEITKLMLYCDFSDEFIAKSTEYEIVVQIQKCHKEYLENK